MDARVRSVAGGEVSAEGLDLGRRSRQLRLRLTLLLAVDRSLCRRHVAAGLLLHCLLLVVAPYYPLLLGLRGLWLLVLLVLLQALGISVPRGV